LKSDYYTWAVWRSGIAIRAVEALIQKKPNFSKVEAEKWLNETLELLDDEKVEGDFGFRKDEIASLKRRLDA